MHVRWGVRHGAAIGTLGAILALCPSAAMATPSGFTIAPVSFPSGTTLTAISAGDPTHIWVVGRDGSSMPLIELGNGSSWAVQSFPLPSGTKNGIVTDVVASSASDAWAVGYVTVKGSGLQPLIEHYDGTWHRLAPAAVKVRVADQVAIDVSGDVWILGASGSCSHRHTRLYRFDGTTWKRLFDEIGGCGDPDGDSFGGLAGIGPGTAALLGGSASHEEGASTPLFACAGAQCPSAPPFSGWGDLNDATGSGDSVWVVGFRRNSTDLGDPTGPPLPLAWHWDGATWTDDSPTTPYVDSHGLVATATVADGSVWAVGWRRSGASFRTLIMHHDGSGWADLGGPDPTPNDQLDDLTHVPGTAGEMWALGEDESGSGFFLLHHD